MENLHYLLMKTNSIFARKIMYEANKIGLTSGQPKVLYFLSKFKEADQKTIANYLEIEQATVGSILLGMEKAGLIERKQHEGNTDKGEEVSKAMLDIFERIENEAIKNIPQEKQEELKILLIEICKSLTDNGVEQ